MEDEVSSLEVDKSYAFTNVAVKQYSEKIYTMNVYDIIILLIKADEVKMQCTRTFKGQPTFIFMFIVECCILALICRYCC